MDSPSSSPIPYKAYQSKRHSRSSSAAFTEPPSSPPTTASTPATPPSARRLSMNLDVPPLPLERSKLNGNKPRPTSMLALSTPVTTDSPEVNASFASLPPSPTASTSTAASSSNANFSRTETVTKALPPRPSSTFRHIPARPHVSSPLRAVSVTARSFGMTSSLPSTPTVRRFEKLDAAPAQGNITRASSASPVPHGKPVTPMTIPAVPVIDISAPAPPESPAPAAQPPAANPPREQPQAFPSSSPSSKPLPAIARTPSPLQTSGGHITASPASSTPARSQRPTPYRPGFQPKGVYRPRTDEFVAFRNARRAGDKIEERRLSRRLDKLIELHFSPQEPKPPPARRSSSFFDLDFSELKGKNASELWRGVLESRAAASNGGRGDIRSAEQNITPWQQDSSVSHCPLCSTSFHPISNRKHHCRLCGQIICSLPPREPNRPQTCSLLIVADPKTGRIDEVGEGVDYGVSRRGVGGKEDDRYLRGVRICRTCRTVVKKRQYLNEARAIPTFTRYYDELTRLEKEILDALPEFQEFIVSLSTDDHPSHRDATIARKRLLESFADYDTIAKRIRSLRCIPGSSQERVQKAVQTRANLFLQEHMFPIQSLSRPQKGTSAAAPEPDPIIDMDSALAHRLQPLLEQEALLESFVEEATAQRKFEDAKTLKTNLEEIRLEIDRITKSGGG